MAFTDYMFCTRFLVKSVKQTQTLLTLKRRSLKNLTIDSQISYKVRESSRKAGNSMVSISTDKLENNWQLVPLFSCNSTFPLWVLSAKRSILVSPLLFSYTQWYPYLPSWIWHILEISMHFRSISLQWPSALFQLSIWWEPLILPLLVWPFLY